MMNTEVKQMAGSYEGATEERCIICEENKSEGIHLINEFICCECEQEIIQTETNEESYRYFVKKLKSITETKLYS